MKNWQLLRPHSPEPGRPPLHLLCLPSKVNLLFEWDFSGKGRRRGSIAVNQATEIRRVRKELWEVSRSITDSQLSWFFLFFFPLSHCRALTEIAERFQRIADSDGRQRNSSYIKSQRRALSGKPFHARRTLGHVHTKPSHIQLPVLMNRENDERGS